VNSRTLVQKYLRRAAIAGFVACLAFSFVALAISTRGAWWPLLAHYWWTLPSIAYTVGSIVWTVRAERMLRKLTTEQRIQMIVYGDLRHDLDDVERYLEKGTTLPAIPVIPLVPKGKR